MGTVKVFLKVGGQEVKDIHRYALRFYESTPGPVPVLYLDGKRVTEAWALECQAEMAEDVKGASA